MTPNRIATLLTALSGIAAAVAVPVANLDTTSTVGVAMGVLAILGAFATWMKGWRAFEARSGS